MQYRILANTDMRVSAVAFGAWAIAGGFTWGPQEKGDSVAALRAAFDHGINFFDTAEGYGSGRSEQLLGVGLGNVRDQIYIATKVSPRHFEPERLREACERSLRNLSTDWIDLYQLHWPNRDIPVEETLGVLEKLKQEGKIRAYGLSNFGRQDLQAALATPYTISSDQLAYNLLFRAIEYEILPLCVEEGVSVLCYSPLMQGLLTGKFATPEQVPDERARTRHYSSSRSEARHDASGVEEETFAAVDAVRRIAGELDESMTNVAIAWLLAQEGVTSVIVGARNALQARSNARAGDLLLSEEAVARLAEATAPLKQKLGRNADMWQSDSRIR